MRFLCHKFNFVCYAMRNWHERLNDIVCYGLLCYAMLWYFIPSMYTEDFQNFPNWIFFFQKCLQLICNAKQTNRVEIILYAILCYALTNEQLITYNETLWDFTTQFYGVIKWNVQEF